MSEDPVIAIDEVIGRLDEATGVEKGPCSGWIKRAPMDEWLNWLKNNIRSRLQNARLQTVTLKEALRSLCREVENKEFFVRPDGDCVMSGDCGALRAEAAQARLVLGEGVPPVDKKDKVPFNDLYMALKSLADAVEYKHGVLYEEHDDELGRALKSANDILRKIRRMSEERKYNGH